MVRALWVQLSPCAPCAAQIPYSMCACDIKEMGSPGLGLPTALSLSLVVSLTEREHLPSAIPLRTSVEMSSPNRPPCFFLTVIGNDKELFSPPYSYPFPFS